MIPGEGFNKAILAVKDSIVFFVQRAIMFYEVIVDAYYTNSGVPEHIYFSKKITINCGDKMKGNKFDATGAVKQLMSKSFTQGISAMRLILMI